MRRTLQKLNTRLMAACLAAVVLLLAAPAARAAESGQCGDNLTWTLDDGLLTIEGSGDMWDFDEEDMAPWYALRGQISRVSLPAELGSIGELAFYDCSRLADIDLPDGVSAIGEYAFASCENLVTLDLGKSLERIHTGAFYGCSSLINFRLPDSLGRIDGDAFYNCGSITSLVIPSGVSRIGSAAFAYCTSLVRAEIRAGVEELPDWMFFGCSQLASVILPDTVAGIGDSCFRDCDSLSHVVYGGEKMTLDELRERLEEDVDGFGSTGDVSSEESGDSATSGSVTENEDGTITEESTTVTESENSSVSSTVEHVHESESNEGGSVSAEITATVENDDGWDEALSSVESTLSGVQQRAKPGTDVKKTCITVYMKDSESVSQSFIDALAGRDIMLTIVTRDGVSWKIDCGEMNSRELSGAYDLRYVVSACTEEQCSLMNAERGFTLSFNTDAQVNAELLIRLPDSTIRQNATLFEMDGKELIRHQASVVDENGFAHFYLGSVSGSAVYLIGVNVDGEEESIVPEELLPEYGNPEFTQPVEYVITGRKSSWGMNISQVTWIMIGIIFVCVVGVGVTMLVLNKRKLKMGYVPNIDEEWDEDE